MPVIPLFHFSHLFYLFFAECATFTEAFPYLDNFIFLITLVSLSVKLNHIISGSLIQTSLVRQGLPHGENCADSLNVTVTETLAAEHCDMYNRHIIVMSQTVCLSPDTYLTVHVTCTTDL